MKNRLAKRHTQYIFIVCVLLLVVSLVLGLALMSRSKKDMRQLINQHMVSVADTAAAAINGDVLEGITAEDARTYSENYLSIVHALRMVQTAQESKDIKYIYTVKKEGDHFVFTVDPDTVKPAEYGEEVVHTDSMTGVSNKTAYLARIKELNREINAGTAAFATIVFDVNGLKRTNDNYGHEGGDYIIVDAARIIRRVFDKEQIYRIGGDEFITITGAITEEELQTKFDRLAAEVAHFNEEEKRYAMTLSFSWGGAIYRPGVDAAFKEVFKRADQAMYFAKEDYYQRCGNPRNPTDGNKD